MSESCPTPFDEGRLWKGENAAELKAQLQATFQNITRIMDCVGCEKCKLWGKLQTLGAHLDATSAPSHNLSKTCHVSGDANHQDTVWGFRQPPRAVLVWGEGQAWACLAG